MSPIITALLVLLLVAMLIILALAVVVSTPFALPLFARGAPFVPSNRKAVERMLDMARVQPEERLADIGSGDGRIVIAAAKRGALAHGVELNPWLVWWARISARWSGVSERVQFSCGSLWRIDLSPFDVVTVYGLTPMMNKLEQKLERELQPGSRVVSHAFQFPHWPPVRQENGVYLYVIAQAEISDTEKNKFQAPSTKSQTLTSQRQG